MVSGEKTEPQVLRLAALAQDDKRGLVACQSVNLLLPADMAARNSYIFYRGISSIADALPESGWAAAWEAAEIEKHS